MMWMRAALVASCLTLLTAGTLRSQNAKSPAEMQRGLDLVLLVDVSRSMLTNQDKKIVGGNDPQRLRWDAVKLAIDLLTVEDRVLVLPFNDFAPATYFSMNMNRRVHVPGKLPETFSSLARRDDRKKIVSPILEFIHDNDTVPNTDAGFTGIIDVLGKASEYTGALPPGRQLAVILLTDGEDTSGKVQKLGLMQEENLRRTLHYYAGGNVRRPIYTIGLGAAAKPDLLLAISKVSGGSYFKATSNRDLISTFRRLIWDLKGYWILEAEGRNTALASRPVSGIVDLGVLCFRDLGDARRPDGTPDPRTTDPPLAAPQRTWTGLAPGESLGEAFETGKNRRGYGYYYFGRETLFDPSDPTTPARSPFARFGSRTIELELKLGDDERPQHVFIGKRTESPLFTIVEPSENARFFRNRPARIAVQMARSDLFQPANFRLRAQVTAIDARSDVPLTALIETELKPESDAQTFVGELSVADLPGTSASVDYFTLVVSAEGLETPRHSLSGYELVLPRRTIGVDNTLLLAPLESFELSRGKLSQTIDLATQFRVQGSQALRLRLSPPQLEGKPLAREHLVFTAGGSRVSGEEHEFPLQDGRASLSLALDPDRLPPGGVSYAPGKLTISGGKGVQLRELAVEFRVRIDTVKLQMEPAAVSLKAEAMPLASPPVRLRPSPADQSTVGVQGLKLQLRPKTADTKAIDPKELWLQPPGPAVAAGQRKQSLELAKLDDPWVVFVHSQDSQRMGRLDWEVVASGKGVDTTSAAVTLFISPPELLVRTPSLTLQAEPGARRGGAYQARLKGLPGVQDAVFVRQPGTPQIRLHRTDKPEQTAEFEVHVADEEHALMLTTQPAEDETWHDLPLNVVVPSDTPLGHYRGELRLMGRHIEETPLTLDVVVDALQLEVLQSAPAGGEPRWTPLVDWSLVQIFDRPMLKRMRLSSRLGQPLAPDTLQVQLLEPFSNERGDVVRIPQAQGIQAGGGSSEVQLELRFPKIVNADPGEAYTFRALFASPELGLKAADLPVRVRFVRAEEIIVPADPAP